MESSKKPSYYNCYVSGCSNSTLNYNKSFFSVPTNLQRRTLWLKLMNREDLLDAACKRARVCQDHFSPTSVKHLEKRTILLTNSYPELLLPIPERCERETQTELDEITLCVCDLQMNYQVQTLIKTNNYIVKSYTKLTDPLEGESSSTNERKSKGRASTCKTTKLIPLLQRAEDIVASVYNYLQAEYEQLKSSLGTSCDLSPLANILQRTAAATGVSEQAVSAVLEEKKRESDEELLINASDAKRAKFSHDYGDGNVSPITDDESGSEAPDQEQDDITEQDEDEDNHQQTRDESQGPAELEVETLKVEIKEEADDIPVDPLQMQISESQLAVQHLLSQSIPSVSSTNTHTVHVSKPPAVIVYPQSNIGVVRVISIEPMTSLPVKTEPDDDPPNSDTTPRDVEFGPPS